MPFKYISYLELWQPFCSAERNHFSHFGRRYPQEQFWDFFLNLGQWFRSRCCLKDFYPVQLSGTIYAILKEGIIGNIHVNLY